MRSAGVLYCMAAAPAGAVRRKCRKSDVEEAVIGYGKVEGPFTEMDGLDIERDERFPVRVTVQFYKATSTGVVSEADLAEIGAQIGKVYQQANYVGSLVVEGETGRPTEYDGPKEEPPGWWDAFWHRHLEYTGQTREESVAMRTKLLGRWWRQQPVEVVEEACSGLAPAGHSTGRDAEPAVSPGRLSGRVRRCPGYDH